MFGASVRLRDGVALVQRPSVIDTYDGSAASRRKIETGLDALGVGVWDLEHSSGGCHTFTLWLDNGSGDYVFVSDAFGPVNSDGDADQFSSGGVLVGFYMGEQWDEMTNGEGVYFTEGFAEGDDRETAIVDAVRRVFDAVGFTADGDGLDWQNVAMAVSAGVCDWCDGLGVRTWQGVDSPCSGCEKVAQASTWGV